MSHPLDNEEPEPWETYARKRFRGRGGKPASDRLLQIILKDTGIPIFRQGHTKLVFPSRADRHLARLAEEQNLPPPRRRGRPRAVG
jgi:hypothetical protein